MSFEQKDMTGALFKNDKRSNDRAPDYTGNCKVGGRELRLAAWLKKDRNGKAYMSLSFSEPQQRQDAGHTAASFGHTDQGNDSFEDDFLNF